MLSDGKRSFTYDAANRLSHVTTQDGNTQVNRYDGEGLRAEMEENGRLVQFLFDGDKVVAETDCDQNVIRYIRGYELVSSDCEKARTYYHYASDELGSITHITDEAGNVCNHYEYDAFGDFTVREETVANRFGFTGEQYDPVAGLYYLRARFYNPVIGRFIQEDTYYGDGLNLYAYCGNNPVRYVDPSGHKKECPIVTDIGDQLKALGFNSVDIENLKGKLKYKRAQTKQNLLDQIRNAGKDVDKIKDIIDNYYAGMRTSKRQMYMGATPSKYSKVGREVIKRMHKQGLISGDISKIDDVDFDFRTLQFKSLKDGGWYDIVDADMSHVNDAVTWWNKKGRFLGPKAPRVRRFMTNPYNYYLEHYSYNRSGGAQIGETYKPPV